MARERECRVIEHDDGGYVCAPPPASRDDINVLAVLIVLFIMGLLGNGR